MKAVAASSIGQYEAAVRALADYERSVELGLSVCFRQGWPTFVPSSGKKGTGTVGVIVFGSDQGLVGHFNEAMAEFVESTLSTLPGEKKIWTVGERMNARKYRALGQHSSRAKRTYGIEGGSDQVGGHACFRRLLPKPSRQAARRDSRGRRRWTDVMWDDYKVAAEIDGAQHTEDPLQRWDDMERDNDLNVDGYRTLRFPAWLVRQHPELVAGQIRRALRGAGYRD